MKNYRTKGKGVPATNRNTFNNQKFAGANNGFDVFNVSRNLFFIQRCKTCGTDDLLHAVENAFGLFCRRCEQRVEHVRRSRPHIIADVRRAEVAR
jgi:hypothetical protein